MPHTPGPWTALSLEFKDDVLGFANPDDIPLVLQAPAMYELLKELEWSAEHHLHYSMCPVCYEIGEHSFDCKLAAVLKAVEGT